MIGQLPISLNISGEELPIRSDFRDCLAIMEAFNDPELTKEEKFEVMVKILYEDYLKIKDYDEAISKAIWFLNCGEEDKNGSNVKAYDWSQDENLIFPAVNKVAGFETRIQKYIHWWTFVGYFMEISESQFSTIVSIRQKKAKGKKLDKIEQEFYQENKDVIDLKKQYTEEEKEEINRLNSLLNS